MPATTYQVHHCRDFQYVDEGVSSDGPPVVLLHGMLGDLSNWTATIGALADAHFRVLAPILPVYDMPLKHTSVPELARFVHAFLDAIDVHDVVVVGNSLGGHVAIFFAHFFPSSVSAMVLSGSSGIYEVEMGTSTPRRKDRSFIRERAEYTFYKPVHATEELVDEMFAIVNNRSRVLRLIRMARSARNETVTHHLPDIDVPTLLVWGRNDRITPPHVAEEFMERLPQAELHFIDHCGHAPMIEQPEAFNRITLEFLRRQVGTPEPLLSS